MEGFDVTVDPSFYIMKTKVTKTIELDPKDLVDLIRKKFGNNARVDFHTAADSSDDFYGGIPSYYLSKAVVTVDLEESN